MVSEATALPTAPQPSWLGLIKNIQSLQNFFCSRISYCIKVNFYSLYFMLWLELNCIFILLPSNLGNGIRRSIIQFFLKILLIGLSCVTYHRPTIHSKICRSIYFNCKRRQQTAESKTRIHLNETWRLSSSLFLWASENNFILIQISPRPCLDHHHHLSSKSRLRSKQAMYYMRNSKLAFHNWSFQELLLHFSPYFLATFLLWNVFFLFLSTYGWKIAKTGPEPNR